MRDRMWFAVGVACGIVGGLCVLVVAAVVIGGRTDDLLEERNRRKYGA